MGRLSLWNVLPPFTGSQREILGSGMCDDVYRLESDRHLRGNLWSATSLQLLWRIQVINQKTTRVSQEMSIKRRSLLSTLFHLTPATAMSYVT